MTDVHAYACTRFENGAQLVGKRRATPSDPKSR